MVLDPRYTIIHSSYYDDPLGSNECECFRRYHLEKEGEKLAFIGFSSLGLLLLLFCALLAGLTLAICSLDIIWLQVLSMTGTEKQRNKALVISRIKRNESWFLCAMIICSVACAESLPILIQSLFGTSWLPIVISTIAIAVFAELFPQYLIPRNAIFWGYYCSPFIWFCMWITCIISWPLSYLLDKIVGPQIDRGIYTIEQLGILVKFHERAEKHGGLLGPDAGRVMRGALDLDHRTLRGTGLSSSRKARAPLADVEKGGGTKLDITVPWSSVRCIGVNEEVTKELILRIKGWAYSRIPVVGDLEAARDESTDCCGDWDNQKVYGFLHVKNLVALELQDEYSQSKKVFVKDLPLYPLPIVRDDLPLFDLLNVFQLGMARMALVIPKPTKDQLAPLSASVNNGDALPRHGAPLWSASGGLNTRNTIEMRALDAQVDWTTDFLEAAQNDIKIPYHRKHSIIGIGCPKPIGIVTYEDILDALFQKTSLDEKDFFGRGGIVPPTKGRKEGDDVSVSSNHSTVRTRKTVPAYVQRLHAAFERTGENKGTLRRRNISGPDICNNGVSGPSGQGLDGANDRKTASCANEINDCSSYTENSLGGFHSPNARIEGEHDLILPSLKQAAGSESWPAFSPAAMSITLATNEIADRCPNNVVPVASPSNPGVATGQPKFRRATPFLTQASLSYERSQAVKHCGKATPITLPLVSIHNGVSSDGLDCENRLDVDSRGTFGQPLKDATEPFSVPSYLWDESPISATITTYRVNPLRSVFGTILNRTPATKDSSQEIYSAAPSILSRNGEFASSNTMLNTRQNEEIRLREASFHDDRTLLPSQKPKSGRIESPSLEEGE